MLSICNLDDLAKLFDKEPTSDIRRVVYLTKTLFDLKELGALDKDLANEWIEQTIRDLEKKLFMSCAPTAIAFERDPNYIYILTDNRLGALNLETFFANVAPSKIDLATIAENRIIEAARKSVPDPDRIVGIGARADGTEFAITASGDTKDIVVDWALDPDDLSVSWDNNDPVGPVIDE